MTARIYPFGTMRYRIMAAVHRPKLTQDQPAIGLAFGGSGMVSGTTQRSGSINLPGCLYFVGAALICHGAVRYVIYPDNQAYPN